MTRFSLLWTMAAVLAASCDRPPPEAAPSPTAEVEILDLSSRVFGNTRHLRVWLPPGYDAQPDRRFPVLYLNDGQNLFDVPPGSLSGAEWRVDETAEQLVREGKIEPLIIVGVDVASSDRANEYLPFEDAHYPWPTPSPHGADYPAFLFDEVVPLIDARFRTDPERRALGGSSYGGLISVYSAIARPGAFDALLVESPSLYVDDAHILRLAGETKVWPPRIYIGIGTHEGASECRDDNRAEEPVADVRRLEEIVKAANPAPTLMVAVEACGLHREQDWARRLPAALEFLFPPNAGG